MSNNKQSMKLYTEEQIRNAMRADFILDEEIDNLINKLTPIEIPSDEEIDQIALDFAKKYRATTYEISALIIAKYMRDKIRRGNK